MKRQELRNAGVGKQHIHAPVFLADDLERTVDVRHA